MDLDKVYKEQLPTSHAAGLQAVFQAGVDSVRANQDPEPEAQDPVQQEEIPE